MTVKGRKRLLAIARGELPLLTAKQPLDDRCSALGQARNLNWTSGTARHPLFFTGG